MALFSDIQPGTQLYTAPKRAKGGDKFWLALTGKNADGSNNGWGDVASWIPGVGVAQQLAASSVAKGTGLKDVQTRVDADMDNRLTKLGAAIGAGQAVAGALTGNVGMVSSGVGSLFSGVAGGVGADSADEEAEDTQNRTSYLRFADGGIAKPKDKTKMVRESTKVAPSRKFGYDADIDTEGAAQMRIQDVNRSDAANGAAFTRDWIKGRAAAGMGGMKPSDAASAASITAPGVVDTGINNLISPQYNRTRGLYDSGSGKATVYPNMTPDLGSTAAHEATHQWQHSQGGIGTGRVKPAWDNTNAMIQQALFDSPFEQDDYLGDPVEVHARLMQMRMGMGLKPTDKVTPSLFKKREADMLNTRNDWGGGNGAYQQLQQVLTKEQIRNLLDKTAMNDKPTQTDFIRAATGAKIEGNGYRIYGNDEKHIEDLEVLDKNTGEKIAEMRYGEGVFSQKATIKMETLAQKKDSLGIGDLVMKEIKRWDKEPEPAFQVAEGGNKFKPKPKPKNPYVDTGAFWPKPMDEPMPTLLPGYGKVATKSGIVGVPNINRSIQARADVLPQFSTVKPDLSLMGKKGGDEGLDWLSTGIDALKTGVSAIGAAQSLPVRQRNPELGRIEEEMRQRAETGLSAADRINLMQQQAQGYAKDIDTITSTVGGGGSAAAVIAGMGAASNRANAVGQQIETTDRAVRMENVGTYYKALKSAQGEDDAQYTNLYNNTIASRDAFAKSMGANLQNISDRAQYEKTYGDGSAYMDFVTNTRRRREKDQNYTNQAVTSLTF